MHAEAVAELVAERYEEFVGYARKRLRVLGVPASSADPEDLVQTALTNVLAHGESVEKLRPYVYAVIKNEVSHAARRYRSGQGYGSLDTDLRLESAGLADSPSAEVDLRLDLQAAMRALPRQQRRVMFYRARGYTQTETAAALGTAPGTVATHMSRAVVALKLTLGALAVVLAGSAASWLWVMLHLVTPAAGGPVAKQSWEWLSFWGVLLLASLATTLALSVLIWTWGTARQALEERRFRSEQEGSRFGTR
ncbi:sigma-70 family RNA polymerase sigma factor [Streptomyces canus]|uniref:sigma-70 family RNA polymerase sigma factor n=1 Tax=Streptomyces canus TaxID=58343 RepID=UPI0032466A99